MIETSQILGRWKNSKQGTKGISTFTFTHSNGDLMITVEGSNEGQMSGTYGPLPCVVYAPGPGSTSFSAFEISFATTERTYFLAGNINKGLIIIASYIQSTVSDESNFFIREFFYKLK